MRTLSINNRKILVVEVPEVISDFEIENDRLYCYPDGDILSQHGKYIPLPHGSWKILAKASEITEEQAKGIVDEVAVTTFPVYPDYDFKPTRLNAANFFTTALNSFRSLCAKEGIKENDLLLIEQI